MAQGTARESATLVRGAESCSAPPVRDTRWLISPWYDLLFVANLGWPLVLLLQWDDGFVGRDGLQFWQVYFVTTPHRWITLLIVFFDRDRFAQRRGLFLLLAAVSLTACSTVLLTTGGLTCLLAIDYIWNAWHFAAQHHGVYRLYRRNLPDAPTALLIERWSMRLLLLYVALRVALFTSATPAWESLLDRCDWLALVVIGGLLTREYFFRGLRSWGSVAYLTSTLALYGSLLAAIHWRQPVLVLCLTTASALFHATEYLAIIGWSIKGRHARHGERMGILAYFAPRWGITLVVFAVVIGMGGWLMNQHWLQTWLFLNVVVAFLHYAYDCIIWRRDAAQSLKASKG